MVLDVGATLCALAHIARRRAGDPCQDTPDLPTPGDRRFSWPAA